MHLTNDDFRSQFHFLCLHSVKAIKVNLGSKNKEEQLSVADLRFLVKVNMVATYIGMQTAIYDAYIKFKPSPNWWYDKTRIILDENGNGPEADEAGKILSIISSDDANDENFLNSLKEVMRWIAVCPTNYIIHKGARRYCNTDIANKIIRTANEVSNNSSYELMTHFIKICLAQPTRWTGTNKIVQKDGWSNAQYNYCEDERKSVPLQRNVPKDRSQHPITVHFVF